MTVNERKVVQFLMATMGQQFEIKKMARMLRIPANEASQIMTEILSDIKEENDGSPVIRRSQKTTVQ